LRFHVWLAVLVAAALATGLLAGCGSSSKAVDPYTLQIRPNPTLPQAPGRDPDTKAESGSHANVVVRFLGKNHYQLRIVNTSDIGFINAFTWLAPRGLTVTAVTGSSDGTCRLSGNDIWCSGMAIRPPVCACRSGGRATVSFTAETASRSGPGQSYGIQGSGVRIAAMTPVPYLIPSHLGVAPALDLPLCAKGQESTKAKPCIHTG
jgi:hypothetical protein